MILLHEAGHIASGVAGSYESHLVPAILPEKGASSPRESRLSTQAIPKEAYRMTTSKSNEIQADLWSADWIRSSLENDDKQEVVKLGEQLLALADNWLSRFSRERFLNYSPTPGFIRALNPNETNYGRREVVYGDGSISHPNIELRMLIIRDRVLRTGEARKALVAYLKERREMAILELVDKPSRKLGRKTTQ